jgi:serine/threonine-protein kinase PRP4
MTQSAVVEEPEPEPLDEDALIEQRRKRREAIKAKYRGSAPPLLVQALQLGDKPGQSQSEDGDTPTRSSRSRNQPHSTSAKQLLGAGSPAVSTPGTPQAPGSPTDFAITDDQDLANKNDIGDTEDDGPSAADYDPTIDMREDQQRDDKRHNDEVSSGAYDETKPTTEQDVLLPANSLPVEEVPKKSKDDFDMFAEDDDDMFAEEPAPNNKLQDNVDEIAKAVPIPQAKELDIGMLDNWDDPEGYYKVILGELLNGRYHVQANLGKGMFSGVVRAMDVTSKKLVAIKLIRNNETM